MNSTIINISSYIVLFILLVSLILLFKIMWLSNLTKSKFMFNFIMVFLLLISSVNAQTNKDVLKQIAVNNKEIKVFREYSNSLNISSKTNLFPVNPVVEYSYLSGSDLTSGNKQEFIISQSFDFPSIYFQKSDIAGLQNKSNEFQLKIFKLKILVTTQNYLNDYIYWKTRIDELTKRMTLAENIYKTLQIRFEKGDIGILELNKSKSLLNLAVSKLNMAKIELNSILSELVNLNGGKPININFNEYQIYYITADFDSLFTDLRKSDYNIQSFETEKELYEKKLGLAKSGWLPEFGIGYRQDNENDIKYNGLRLQMSIPVFENTNQVPKAESELNYIDVKIQSYISKFYIEKKRLHGKAIELENTVKMQKEILQNNQLELNLKSYELGHISLTQFYYDNMIFYEIIDSVTDTEREYQKVISELMIEILAKEL